MWAKYGVGVMKRFDREFRGYVGGVRGLGGDGVLPLGRLRMGLGRVRQGQGELEVC